ncbi:MAG: 50S ribosomal protein L9 [Candidatus Limnocylindria bacterium]
MRVVLRKEVPGLGRPGDVKHVAEGYAQNFLLPRGLAVEASEGELKRVAQVQAVANAKKSRAHAEAEAIAARLASTRLTFQLKAGESGKTFGSVTNRDVADALRREAGIEVDRTKIHLEEPLRGLGTHEVEVRLLTDVRARLTVTIEPQA